MFYITEQLSENLSETPEGFLVCSNVPITRVGALQYAPGEVPVQSNNGNIITITRTSEDVFDPMTLASFEGKPVTIGHPSEFVSPENWKRLAVGSIQNVRQGEGEESHLLMADLLVTDASAISLIKGGLREVSCGYDAKYVDNGDGTGRQTLIRGNHLALVRNGRAGAQCAIGDSFGEKLMKLTEKIKGIFARATDDAEKVLATATTDSDVEGLEQEIKDAESKLAELMAKRPAKEEAKDAPDQMAEFASRIAKLEETIAKMSAPAAEDKSKAKDEATVTHDQETIARAEILAPGIAVTDDLKAAALKVAYATTDGKAVIDTLCGGSPTFDDAALFVSAAELIKAQRKSATSTVDTKTKDVKTVDGVEHFNARAGDIFKLPTF
jgi:hypothetical protein